MIVLSEFQKGLIKFFRRGRALMVGILSLLVASHSLATEFGDPKKINLPLGDRDYIQMFDFLADTNRAFYDVVNSSSGYRKLYNAELNKSPGTAVNITGSRNLRNFAISPDGEYIVYSTSSSPFNSPSLLQSQKSDISEAPVALSPQLSGGRDIASQYVSPDSKTVIFISEESVDNLRELYSVPITGPSNARIKLSGPMDPPSDSSSVIGVSIVAISPDSTRVLYKAKQVGDTKPELYSVATDGSSPPVRLTNLSDNNTSISSKIKISPDSSQVTFISDYASKTHYELYRIPITGPSSAAVKLNHVSDGESVWDSRISPDGSAVVYTSARSDFVGLYSVPMDRSSEPVLLNPIPVPGGSVSIYFAFTPDSSRVVFLGDLDTDRVEELYSVPVAGPSSEAVKLHADLVANQRVESFDIVPDGSSVVFRMDTSIPSYQSDLYLAPVDGSSQATMLNVNAHDKVNVKEQIFISTNSEYVVYLADQDTDDITEMYSVSLKEPQLPVKLNAPLPAGGQVASGLVLPNNYVRISPNSKRILYSAEQVTDDVTELFMIEQKSDDESCFVVKTAAAKVVTFCL
ncbi:hypothetical protein GCM10008090_05630 [Arenicella chitinivorans]|uniref:Uncharacterized protein n=2 Tax=Arenicella chitinivorans TaxID=1329800 RepID=A0A918VIY1_9GAMM|nr:hypothetical protein GCM10008090_05630 [Arenicella chitinivorans]